jgi:hypothetical protein
MAGGQDRCMTGMPAVMVRLGSGCSTGRLRVVRGYAIAEGRSGGASTADGRDDRSLISGGHWLIVRPSVRSVPPDVSRVKECLTD